MNFSELANFIWSVADLLRGDYKQADYGKVILPFTLLRRLDCVLEPTKKEVLAEYAKRKEEGVNLDIFLKRKSKQSFYNVSPFTVPGLLADPGNIRQNLIAYIGDFSADAREVFELFKFNERIAELDDRNLLYMLVQKFASIDLHPDTVPNETMGLVFEDLIRRFAEASNETAGEHFTPRDAIKLIVQCLFVGDSDALSKPGVVRSLYDPTAGTGGMLSVGQHELHKMNPGAKLALFGQELNDESYAICKADMLIKGQNPGNIRRGNTLSADGFPFEKFDYSLSNPPFGVDWKKVLDFIKTEHEKKGYGGRFGPGLPRISDGAMLFLLHLISKMRPPAEGGSRIGIVLNGSPLFTGDAGSGESEIRRWILENDLLEAIIALPNDLFYNTGIATYVWILDNDKRPDRKGKVQLIDASRMYQKMKKSLGNKRVEVSDAQIAEIVEVYAGRKVGAVFENEFKVPLKNNGRDAEPEAPRVVSKEFDTKFFGYRKVTVDRPPAEGKVVKVKKGQKPYDPDLRDTESIPLTEPIEAYFKREVLPHVPDAWVNPDIKDEKDGRVGKVGYEINFNRYFYVYKPPRKPAVIAEEIREMEKRFLELMKGVVA
ncbi:MAG: restriction endonuclease subunit M [Hydrogenophilales bacterium 28-61-23]|nr:MAG: restriction endonuclease subunit M [Hydrogenophilales bacterium 28-61-23]